jgi:hypothetical protein
MAKRIKLLSSIAIATVFVAANPASAQYDGHYIWNTTYYSDSSHSTQVGELVWAYCLQGQAAYTLRGTQTAYYEITGPDGECGDEMHPES